MGTSNASQFQVKISVFDNNAQLNQQLIPPTARYCQTVPIPFLASGESIEVTVGNFNPRDFSAGNPNPTFTLQMVVQYPGGDSYRLNDTVFS